MHYLIIFHKVCDLTGFDRHLRFVDLLRTTLQATVVGEVNHLHGFDPSLLSFKCSSSAVAVSCISCSGLAA